MTPDEILTLPEVAGLLKIADKTVYALAQRAEIPAFKVGGQWRFSRAAINSWIEARTRVTTGGSEQTRSQRAKASATRKRQTRGRRR